MDINGKTKILAVIGNPIEHTASPKMHNAMIQHLGLNYIYIPLKPELDNLEHVIKAIKCENILGINVTIPFKEKVIPYLDEIEITASHIGAVNTIVNTRGSLKGYNTDGMGFIESLSSEYKVNVENKKIVIIGAGGAAKSIAFTLINNNISELTIINLFLDQAESLKTNLLKYSNIKIKALLSQDSSIYQELNSADIVINATPIGMEPNVNASPIDSFEWAGPKHFVYDVIYKPKKTLFLSCSKNKGASIGFGYGMLVGQGKIAFELITGEKADYEIMKKEVLKLC
ncbi:shikimate dehydrogenase [Candidatus Margulisiibacteriota bacterium]